MAAAPGRQAFQQPCQGKGLRHPDRERAPLPTWTGQAATEQQTKAYSKEQLAGLSKLSGDLIDRFAMFGLIEPRGDLYGFRDLAAARQIASLLASGVNLPTITQSLAEIRKWLPDAGLANLRLYPEASDRLLVEHRHGRIDKKGQFVLPIEPAKADADALFEEAQASEEAVDWDTAERYYSLVVKIDPGDSAAIQSRQCAAGRGELIDAEAAYRIAFEGQPHLPKRGSISQTCSMNNAADPRPFDAWNRRLKPSPIMPTRFNLALFLQRLERLSEAACQWKRYLELDRTSAWAGRAKRALKFCEMTAIRIHGVCGAGA